MIGRKNHISQISIGLLITLVFVFSSPFCGSIRSAAVFASSRSAARTTGTNGLADTATPYVPLLEIEHTSQSAVVVESGRQRLLYAKSAVQKQNIPASSKMMTAFLACERLPLQTPVTISKVSENAERFFICPDGIKLKSGDKYPLEYLLLRLVFYNSDAAALAIAEQLAGVEEKFVELMNTRAENLNLSDTIFVNCTGSVAYSAGAIDPAVQQLAQYTTPLDLARMVAAAIQNKVFNQLICQSGKYIVLDDDTLISMSNVLRPVWTLSEGRITGAFYSALAGQSYMVAIGALDSMTLVAVTAAGRPEKRLSDIQAVIDSCCEYYEVTSLVRSGSEFTGGQEETVDGEKFGLVFKSTVNYIHPVGDFFLKTTLRYKSFGPFKRPIQLGMTAGQVIFELVDGTMIAVDVAPDRQILTSISIVDKVLGDLQSNRNLSMIILVAGSMLLLVFLLQVIRGFRRLIRLVAMILEKRNRQ
jgi:serine-type D-Ala-D-Ala carboxypeptidase (penicillin-binding protein 5/6)